MAEPTNPAPVLLIGAAHVVDLRRPIAAAVASRPLDGVAIELDAERAKFVLSSDPTSRPNARGAPIFLRLWSVLQRRLGEQIGGGVPGSEMRAAAELARDRQIPLFLIDDPIRETVARLVRTMSPRERVLLLLGGIAGLFLPSGFVERRLEEYSEDPSDYLDEVRRAYPTVARVLLDERNEHMADRLLEIRRRGYLRVATVVGDAHVGGLADALGRRGVPTERMRLGELTRAAPATAP